VQHSRVNDIDSESTELLMNFRSLVLVSVRTAHDVRGSFDQRMD
jgi:hypothetical protein